MIRFFHSACFIALLLCIAQPIVCSGQSNIQWIELDELPNNPSLGLEQPGLAGAYSGLSNSAMLIAGGANFPYAYPWLGGSKKWWSDIYVGFIQEDGGLRWLDSVYQLPIPMGYGISLPWKDGILCIGGNNQEGPTQQVVELKWSASDSTLLINTQPSLPEGFEAVNGGICNGVLLIHGVLNGQNQLLERNKDGSWRTLPGCPGPPRYLSVGVAQNNGHQQSFFVFSGRTIAPDGQISLLKDGYSYDPTLKEWKSLGEIGDQGQAPVCVMGAAGTALGASHILVLGGDDGQELMQRAALEKKIKNASDSPTAQLYQDTLTSLFEGHKGFSNQIWSYHTLTNTWTILDQFPELLPVTTQVISDENKIYITSGEINPGIRTPIIWQGEIKPHEYQFGLFNYAVIILYLLVMIGIGVKFAKRQNSTDDYFKGGGRIPWWAAGLSLFGTSLSAITFMAIPAKTYMTDWAYFFFQMTPILTAPLLIGWYIPYYRRLNITTAYEFLEKRFNLLTRLLGSISFMILQLGRVGIVLFLPSIAIHLVTGIDIELCIIAMGSISIIYTMMGGIEAVIWTDVLQVVVLMGGAILCVIALTVQYDEGPAIAIQTAVDHQKFNLLDTAFDIHRPTIWVVVLGGIFANLITSGSDQTMVQRYLTTATEGEAKRSVWTFALLAIPATLIFFSIGTLLYLFYQQQPSALDPTMANDDAIFPYYIVSQLPAGISGLLIAGVFSAAMSSLSSSMNSVATSFVTDFYQRFSWGTASKELYMARLSTLVFGLLGTGFALLMASWEIQSLWDQLQLYIGLFAGGLGGLFLLGILTKKANGYGAVTGLLISGILQYFLTQYTEIHVLLFAMTGFVSSFVIGYLASFLFPDSTTSNTKL